MTTLPLALSLLHSVATQVPGFQKSSFAAPSVSGAQPQAMASSIPPPVPPKNASTLPPGGFHVNSGPSAPSSSATSTPPTTTSSSSPLCDHCHLRPKHHDGKKLHPYCTKSCAKAHSNCSSRQPSLPSSANCNHCHSKPKYFDGVRTHSYCGKACAKAALSSSNLNGGGTVVICQAPGCQKPAFTKQNGSFGDYCSISHKMLTETLCLLCAQLPKQANSHFCSQACHDEAEKKGPMILEVPLGHVTFKSVADQFKASWRHPGTCPEVKAIYKIVSTKASVASYNTYRANVESRGQFVSQGRSAGNENRRWHGTRRACNLGDPGQTQFCNSTTCSLCCIIRTSFDLSMWGKKTGWGRFGKGLYTSSTSSKSNDYSCNDCKSNLKAILLNKVIVGKGCKLTQDNTSLVAPPSGFDSVLAEKGGSLNYDELVVYTNDAIRPSFLVMYEA